MEPCVYRCVCVVCGGLTKIANSSSYFEKCKWYSGKNNNLVDAVMITCGVFGDLQREKQLQVFYFSNINI